MKKENRRRFEKTPNQIAEKSKLPHVRTIFSEPEPKPEPEFKPKKTVREFHGVETENPRHISVVQVQAPTDESEILCDDRKWRIQGKHPQSSHSVKYS